jgi:hypothetical protein
MMASYRKKHVELGILSSKPAIGSHRPAVEPLPQLEKAITVTSRVTSVSMGHKAGDGLQISCTDVGSLQICMFREFKGFI